MKNPKSKNKKEQNRKQKHSSNYTIIQRKMLELADCFERARIARERSALKQSKDMKIILRHKNVKEVRLLIHAKRGFRTNNQFICSICDKVHKNGWIYNLDERYIYLCNSCKEQAKPRKIINKLVLYSAFESGKKR